MSLLYRVVEKKFNQGRTNFVLEGGIWHARIEDARKAAERIAQTTLAHRLFIVNSIGTGKPAVLEEVELAPLEQRLAHLHETILAVRHPTRLAAERAALGGLPKWRQRLPQRAKLQFLGPA